MDSEFRIDKWNKEMRTSGRQSAAVQQIQKIRQKIRILRNMYFTSPKNAPLKNLRLFQYNADESLENKTLHGTKRQSYTKNSVRLRLERTV